MRSLVVTADAADVELASDRLWQLGARGIEERQGPAGHIELWTVIGDDDAALAAAVSRLDGRWRWRTEECADDWPETWRDHARPVPIGDRMVVVPAWSDLAGTPADDRVRVVIEPGAAFGLGDHPTTALTLEALDRAMRCAQVTSVLDVGCGTGVLSIAAALLGARTIRAVDISTAAVESTIHNAERNGVADRIETDTAETVELVGEYDLVLANVLAPALIAMSDDLRRLTAPDGRLVVSGILADAHDHVLESLAPMGVVHTVTSAGWAAVTLTHS